MVPVGAGLLARKRLEFTDQSWVVPGAGTVLISAVLVLEKRRYVVSEMTVKRSTESDAGITGEVLRKIPVHEVVAIAIGVNFANGFLKAGTETTGKSASEQLAEQRANVEAAIARMQQDEREGKPNYLEIAKRVGPTDDTLRDVAFYYIFSELLGMPPAKTVAEPQFANIHGQQLDSAREGSRFHRWVGHHCPSDLRHDLCP